MAPDTLVLRSASQSSIGRGHSKRPPVKAGLTKNPQDKPFDIAQDKNLGAKQAGWWLGGGTNGPGWAAAGNIIFSCTFGVRCPIIDTREDACIWAGVRVLIPVENSRAEQTDQGPSPRADGE